MVKIGVLSDTHDMLRPEVIEALRDCSCIFHGGDISSPRILHRLEQLAPVHAVRGNNDGEWAADLPTCLDTEAAGLRVFMTHKKKDLPRELGVYDLVICGHTHQYASVWIDRGGTDRRTLLLNPGSCGPRRFHQPITLAVLTVEGKGVRAERIDIPHTLRGETPKADPGDMKARIEIVVKETRKGTGPAAIAAKYGMDPALAEQIARLYLTHPGVTADGIMAKMGL